MQLSTAASDGVLALSAFAGAGLLVYAARPRSAAARRAPWLSALGLCALGLPALCGAVRHAGAEGLAAAHLQLSAIAGLTATPSLGLGAIFVALDRPMSRATTAITLALLAALAVVGPSAPATVALAAGVLGVLGLVAAAALLLAVDRRRGALALIGAALFPAARFAIGTQGALFGLLRVDLFHYALALACWLLAVPLAARAARASC
ncbi:MAG: hypothetical protein R3A51_17235 [Nannocystaceae bacterium]|nr:hypothetical protein [Myxococcales bacterium]